MAKIKKQITKPMPSRRWAKRSWPFTPPPPPCSRPCTTMASPSPTRLSINSDQKIKADPVEIVEYPSSPCSSSSSSNFVSWPTPSSSLEYGSPLSPNYDSGPPSSPIVYSPEYTPASPEYTPSTPVSSPEYTPSTPPGFCRSPGYTPSTPPGFCYSSKYSPSTPPDDDDKNDDNEDDYTPATLPSRY